MTNRHWFTCKAWLVVERYTTTVKHKNSPRIIHIVCTFWLVWISNHMVIKCEMKLFIYSQTSTVQPLKFGNGSIIPSRTWIYVYVRKNKLAYTWKYIWISWKFRMFVKTIFTEEIYFLRTYYFSRAMALLTHIYPRDTALALGTEVIIWLSQFQRNNPEGYG